MFDISAEYINDQQSRIYTILFFANLLVSQNQVFKIYIQYIQHVIQHSSTHINIINKYSRESIYRLMEVALLQTSKCIETMCRPGTITKPKTLASVCSMDRYSVHEPKITLASRSVHRNAPLKTLPSVISIRRCRFSQLLSFCFAGDSSEITACCKTIQKHIIILKS